MHFVRVHTVVPTQLGRNPVLFHQIDFHMINSLLIAVYAFSMRVLITFSIDEILLPRNGNWSFNFRSLPLQEEMSPSRLKHMNSSYMLPAACSRLCNWDSSWAGYMREALDHLRNLWDIFYFFFYMK